MIPSEILKKVRQIEIRARGVVNTVLSGAYSSSFKGRGMEFSEVREYVPGDEIRTIDWNVTARQGHPYVKKFTEERELTLMLLVDRSGSTDFGEPQTKAALALEVAAVLALAAAWHNDRVGALLFADRVERVVPPAKGRRHALRVLRDVLAYEPAGRRTSLGNALTYAADPLAHRSIVVVLSDFLDEGWERPLRQLQCAARGQREPQERREHGGGHEQAAHRGADERHHDRTCSAWRQRRASSTTDERYGRITGRPRSGGRRLRVDISTPMAAAVSADM